MWLCKELSSWQREDFLHLVLSDEFFLWATRKTNHQDDIVWAESLDDIRPDQHFRDVLQHPTCVGYFVLFTARRLM